MPTDSVTTQQVDYLQRCGAAPALDDAARTAGEPKTRRLLRVRGIGRPEKEHRPAPFKPDRWRPPTTELITGLYGYRIPLAFSVRGSAAGVQIQLGTWSARAPRDGVQERRVAVIESVLRGLYPVVDLAPDNDEPAHWPVGGFALGVPAPVGVDESDGAAPLDRIVRSLAGASFTALVLAYPVGEDAIGDVRGALLNEMRVAQSAAKNELAPSPLTEQYVELLKTALETTGESMATGAWRTAVYLLGDGDSYPRLATAWRSVMSGEDSLPEPVRVFDAPQVDDLAREWAMLDTPGAPAPGHYQRPFENQTLLSTAQLAAYVHLPELEAPGFTVSLVPRFDVVAVPTNTDRPHITIGDVLHNRVAIAGAYNTTLHSLTRHTFVAGLTGSGKTNTIMAMLQQAAAAGVPFCVVEPAKTEYRALIDDAKLGNDLRVFTAGKDTVAPFVLNPFEVPQGIAVSEHLDLLRAVFTAAFGMWTPLPQILERCLHDVYIDRGWDLRTNENARLRHGDDRADAFPTLADLIAKVGEVLPELGYEEKITGDMRAALVTRLESLRHGGKGAMLDVSRSLPVDELFEHPTVIELEAMGDEGDKAFISGLLLIRLAEHRRVRGQSDDLVHLLVVEEAHRLLGNVPTQVYEEAANPRGQAVETFANLLSEIRAYGQGVVIADQVPVRLAPDVMKNTNLKIAHRIVSNDDREALAGAMAMDDKQARALASLVIGEAVVFSGGDDAPLLVRVPLVKDAIAAMPPADARVAAHMAEWRAEHGFEDLFLPRPFCAQTCATRAVCDAARTIAHNEYAQRTLARVVLSAIDEPGAVDRLWDDLVGVLRAERPPLVPEDALLRAFAGHGADWLATRRGAQGVWSYSETEAFRTTVQDVLLDKLAGGGAQTAALRGALQQLASKVYARDYEPYPACGVVCSQQPAVCLYRAAVADTVASRRYLRSWLDADDADAKSEGNRREQTWEVCQDAAFELVEFPDDETPADVKEDVEVAARRVCVCFEQQMLAADHRKVPRSSRRILSRLIAESGL